MEKPGQVAEKDSGPEVRPPEDERKARKQEWKDGVFAQQQDGGRLNAMKEAIAKEERVGEWRLVPSKIADFLLSPASQLEIHTFKDNKDLVTYDRVADNGIWSLNGTKEIEQVVSELVAVCGGKLKEQLSRFVMGEVIAQVQWRTYIDRESFTSPPGKVPLVNGVYDLATDTLEAHSKENNFLYQVPVKYDRNALCPAIAEFIVDILPADKRALPYEMAGCMVCANAESVPNRWQRAFMDLGPGDNGKSTYLNVATKLLGDENVSNQTLQALVENRFAVAALDHKLANIAADIGDRSLYATAQFKNLTGGDKITAEHKFKDPYEFRNRAILAFSCNILPESYDDSNAYHKRWVIQQFENVFSGTEKDSKLLEKLTTPEELSGFFNAAIEAYRAMTERGTFTGEGETVEKKRELYTKLSDPVQCFMDECVLFDPEGMVNKQHLYTEFRAYAQKRGYGKTFTQKRFFKKFREKAGEQLYESYVKDGDGVPRRTYKGIKLETTPA